MAPERISSLLSKIQIVLSTENQVSRLEKELVKDYLRELFVLIDEMPEQGQFRSHYFPPVVDEPAETLTPKEPHPEVATTKDTTPPPMDDPPSAELPRREEQEAEPVLISAEAATEGPAVSAKEEKQNGFAQPTFDKEETVTEMITARVPTPPKYRAIFEVQTSNEISDVLSRSPIADLNQAFSINDKLIIVNELFGGEQESFQDTIDILNRKYSFDEAKTHLLRYVIDKYGWLDEEKVERAREFVRLVERRYLG